MVEAVVVGLVAGYLAGKLLRGRGYGIVMDILLGLSGAFIGSWLLGGFGVAATGLVGASAISTIGAIVLIGASRLIAAL